MFYSFFHKALYTSTKLAAFCNHFGKKNPKNSIQFLVLEFHQAPTEIS